MQIYFTLITAMLFDLPSVWNSGWTITFSAGTGKHRQNELNRIQALNLSCYLLKVDSVPIWTSTPKENSDCNVTQLAGARMWLGEKTVPTQRNVELLLIFGCLNCTILTTKRSWPKHWFAIKMAKKIVTNFILNELNCKMVKCEMKVEVDKTNDSTVIC